MWLLRLIFLATRCRKAPRLLPHHSFRVAGRKGHKHLFMHAARFVGRGRSHHACPPPNSVAAIGIRTPLQFHTALLGSQRRVTSYPAHHLLRRSHARPPSHHCATQCAFLLSATVEGKRTPFLASTPTLDQCATHITWQGLYLFDHRRPPSPYLTLFVSPFHWSSVLKPLVPHSRSTWSGKFLGVWDRLTHISQGNTPPRRARSTTGARV